MKIAACAAAILASLGATIALARPMTPEDVARLEAVGQIAISPDGAHIAYTTARLPDVTQGEDNGRMTQQLKLATGPDAARDYLPADMNISAVQFSPDGTMIAFLWAEKHGKDAVWGIPLDGGGHRKLAEISEANVLSYRWAPGGNALYMLAQPAKDEQAETARKAGFDAIIFEEEPRFNRLFVAATGKDIDPDPREITLPGHVSYFEITPDGRQALAASAPSPSVDDNYTQKRLHIIDLASGRDIRTVQTSGKIGDLEISPNGGFASLIAATDPHDPAPTTLHLINLADGTLRALNAGAGEAAIDAEYLADGRLAVIIHRGARSLLRIYDANGALSQEMDAGELSLRALATGGNTLAAAASHARHPGELFVVDGADQASLRRWTHHNGWLAGIDFGQQRIITYTARDGQQVEGILIEPVGGIKKGTPAPTILDVHGGPESHESNGWNTNYGGPGQVAAGKGYAVFLPNYRGSTAYGTGFSKAHQGDYAGKEFNDLVDAKQALVKMGITDPARVGITGGSYGGYATAWAATALSEHFAAGVMFVGISNQISKFGTTEIPREMYLVHSRKWPWEDWQFMLERSPIYHAGKARTPLLILHGEDDRRVDPEQSFQLYRNIKLRTDTPVRLVLYPGEGHGNRQAAARYDYNLRMMRWFDLYLKPAQGKGTTPLPPPRLDLPEAILEQ